MNLKSQDRRDPIARDAESELYRLIYASHAVPACLDNLAAEIEAILATSRRVNANLEITGALVAHDGWFLQALEGAEHQVYEVFKRICLDLRHIDVTVLVEAPIATRDFGDWSMCAMELSVVDRKILEKLQIKLDFDPFTCSETLVLNLLKTIAGVQRAYKV